MPEIDCGLPVFKNMCRVCLQRGGPFFWGHVWCSGITSALTTHSWQALGTIWNPEMENLVGHVQDKCPCCCSIAPYWVAQFLNVTSTPTLVHRTVG